MATNPGLPDPAVARAVAAILVKNPSILFITGAGISADSGLPTYRGIGGLYSNTVTDEGLPIETALSGRMLRLHPEVSWKYIHQIEKVCRGAAFNRAHAIIAEMEKEFTRVWVLTQNVDGFHQAAGSQKIIAIHGDIHELYCTQCTYRTRVPDYNGLTIPPCCPICSGLVRPQVVLFEELLPIDQCQVLARELQQGFDLVFSIGTTSVFPYIAQPVVEAHDQGIPTVEINPDMTEVTHLVDYKFACRAVEGLEAIWREYLNLPEKQIETTKHTNHTKKNL